MEDIVKKILAIYQRNFKTRKQKIRTISASFSLDTFIVGFFDGASQAHGSRCGAGGLILLNSNLRVFWKLNLGEGSNT